MLAQKLQVIAAQSIIADWVYQVAGDRVELSTLVKENTDTHTFEPAARDIVALAKGNILFENGLGLEFWLDDLYRSSESSAKRIVLSDKVEKIPVEKGQHSHGEFDPHIWLNVKNTITMVNIISQVLQDADSQNASFYKTRTDAYIKELEKLDAWIFAQVSSIEEKDRKLISGHNSLGYFAKHYGFKILGSILASSSTDQIDPSALHFAKLIRLIRKNKVPGIFSENIENTALIRQLAKETSLPKPKMLYTGALSGSDGPANTYIKLMRHNVKTIVESLK